MIKLFFLMIILFMDACSLKAQAALERDQDFIKELDNIKNPFEDGLPKPVEIINKPAFHQEPRPMVFPKPKPKAVFSPVISLPKFNVQGVMVGEDMHQAIINDQVVPLFGTIKGAKVVAVTKQGVELFYKGKKFFLKVD